MNVVGIPGGQNLRENEEVRQKSGKFQRGDDKIDLKSRGFNFKKIDILPRGVQLTVGIKIKD